MVHPVGIWRLDKEKGRIEISEISEYSRDMAARTGTRVLARGPNREVVLEIDSSYTKEQLEREIERSLGPGMKGKIPDKPWPAQMTITCKQGEQREELTQNRQDFWRNTVGYQNRIATFETATDADPEHVLMVARQTVGAAEEECWTAEEIPEWGIRKIEFGEPWQKRVVVAHGKMIHFRVPEWATNEEIKREIERRVEEIETEEREEEEKNGGLQRTRRAKNTRPSQEPRRQTAR
jgi:hypothetical protein